MFFSHQHCSTFSNDNRFALCSPDGVLQVWDVKIGQVQQEYTPASHLSSTFTCISWKSSCETISVTPTPTKKRKKGESKFEKSKLIVLGTLTGDILLYETDNNELIHKYSDGHGDRVNDICWNTKDTNVFYSCSSDKHIIEWDAAACNQKYRWKGDKAPVYSISVGPYGRTIMTASSAIKLWDLKTKNLLKKYVGHSSPVLSLKFADITDHSRMHEMKTIDVVEGLYFLSAAIEDTVMYAWQVKAGKKRKLPLSSFLMTSKPKMVDLKTCTSKNETTISVLCVTQEGEVNVFSQVLNGPTKAPISSNHTIKVTDEDSRQLSIVSARFLCNDDNCTDFSVIQLAYGTHIRLAFDKVNVNDHKTTDICLVRQDPIKMKVVLEEDNLKLRQPVKKDWVTSLVPGHKGHLNATAAKRKDTGSDETILPILERLADMNVEKTSASSGKNAAPRADSFAVLLTQGLQSNDRDVLNQVLQHSSEALITNTVQQLNLVSIMPLIHELTERLQGSPEKCLTYVKWMRAVLSLHTSYLMTFSEISPMLSRLHQLMNVRTRTQSKLTRLEGKLDLIMTQVLNRNKPTSTQQEQALYVFDDGSSDEQDIDDDVARTDQSDSEWDEFTDLDATGHQAEVDEQPLVMDCSEG